MPVKHLTKQETAALHLNISHNLMHYYNVPQGNYYSLSVLSDGAVQHQNMVQAFLGLGALDNHRQNLPESYLIALFEYVRVMLDEHSTCTAYQICGLFMHVNMKDVPTDLLLDTLEHAERKVAEFYDDMFSKHNPQVVQVFYVRAVKELARRGVL